MSAQIKTCGLLWVFWLAAGRWKQSRPWHRADPDSISSSSWWTPWQVVPVLPQHSLRAGFSPASAKCPGFKRTYWHLQLSTMHSRFQKYRPSRPASCVSEGWSWPASTLFSLILPCFLVIFVGNGYYELFGLSANLSLIVRTLLKMSLFFSIASKHLCTAYQCTSTVWGLTFQTANRKEWLLVC